MVGITEVDTRLLAVRTCITVVGEVNEFDNIVLCVCFSHTEYIDVCLHAGLTEEKITRHFDTGKKGVPFQNLFCIFDRLAAAGRVLDDDGGIALSHMGERGGDKDHPVAVCRVRRIEQKYVGGEGRAFGQVCPVKVFEGIQIEDV